jgi:hypothetical protein
VSSEPRIDIIFASESPRALILRRGPSDWVHVLNWHTDTDLITLGAWFHGRIYPAKCALSPDGELLLHFAACYRKTKSWPFGFAWTAINKPPWITALVRWPQSDTWGGGGSFNDNRSLFLNCTRWRHWFFRRGRIPQDFSIQFAGSCDPMAIASPNRPTTWFDSTTGVDQQGHTFTLQSNCLIRNSGSHAVQVVDFSNMSPEPRASPLHARAW